MRLKITSAWAALTISLAPVLANAERVDIKLVGQQGDMYFFTAPKPYITDQDYLLKAAQGFCFNKAFCYVQFWESGKATPKRFPLTTKESDLMVASYISNQQTGKREMRWKCSLFPRETKDTCFS